jgi:hypothetical protein
MSDNMFKKMSAINNFNYIIKKYVFIKTENNKKYLICNQNIFNDYISNPIIVSYEFDDQQYYLNFYDENKILLFIMFCFTNKQKKIYFCKLIDKIEIYPSIKSNDQLIVHITYKNKHKNYNSFKLEKRHIHKDVIPNPLKQIKLNRPHEIHKSFYFSKRGKFKTVVSDINEIFNIDYENKIINLLLCAYLNSSNLSILPRDMFKIILTIVVKDIRNEKKHNLNEYL